MSENKFTPESAHEPQFNVLKVRANLRNAPQEIQDAVNEVVIRKSSSTRSDLNIKF